MPTISRKERLLIKILVRLIPLAEKYINELRDNDQDEHAHEYQKLVDHAKNHLKQIGERATKNLNHAH